MKLRQLMIVAAVPVLMYAGFSVPIAAHADSAICCENNGGCPDGFRCDYSESCGTLPGHCIPQPWNE